MMVDDIHHFLKVTREKGKLKNQFTAVIINIRAAPLVEDKLGNVKWTLEKQTKSVIYNQGLQSLRVVLKGRVLQ